MSLVRSSLLVAVLTGLSVVLGLLLSVVTAHFFGASDELDAYLAAVVVPTYVVAIVTTTMTVVVIPTFVQHRETDPQKAWTVVAVFTNFAALTATALVLVGILGAAEIIRAVAPGFSSSQQDYSIMMLRVYFPVVVVSVVNEILANIYYAHKRFAAPLLNKMITPALSIAFVVMFSGRLNALSLVIANLVGAVVQCASLAWGIVRVPEFKYRFSSTIYTKEIGRMARLMLPIATSAIIYKIIPVFDRGLVSGLARGSISSLNYASRLQSVALQILSSGISVAVYPRLAELAARSDLVGLKATLAGAVRILFFAAVPIAILSAVLGDAILRLLFEHGAFTAEASAQVYPCFAIYMISLPFVVTGSLLGQGLYVLQDTRSVALSGIAETLLYVVLCLIFVDGLGVEVIPAAYGVYATASVIALGVILRWRIGLGGGRGLIKSCCAYLAVGLAIGGLAWLARTAIALSDPVIVGLFVLCCACFLLITRALRLPDAELLWNRAWKLINRSRVSG